MCVAQIRLSSLSPLASLPSSLPLSAIRRRTHLPPSLRARAQNKRIEATEAANLGRDLTASAKLSVSDAHKCLERLERGRWLAKSDEGYYSLGVRTELQRMYIEQKAEEAQEPQEVE